MNKFGKPELTNNQFKFLKIIYKFRFASVYEISKINNNKRQTTIETLDKLQSIKLINKQYDKSYKLLHKPAVYSLNSKAYNILASNLDIDISKFKYRYNDKNLPDSTKDNYLNIFKCYLELVSLPQYKNATILTEAETLKYDHFPRPVPSLFVINQGKEQFIELIPDNMPLFYIKKRIDNFLIHYSRELWNKTNYPEIILIIEDKNKIKKLSNYQDSLVNFRFFNDVTKIEY